MLNMTAIATMPINKTSRADLFAVVVLLTLNNIYPISRLRQAHSTFTVGDEGPLPGGVEKGDGNGSPEMP